ncbi:Uncharacterised protein [uncultured archaeon]|nr:Uncharacterised protein [uncultured archaeon]
MDRATAVGAAGFWAVGVVVGVHIIREDMLGLWVGILCAAYLGYFIFDTLDKEADS